MKILGHTKIRARTAEVPLGHADDGSPIVLTLTAPSMVTTDKLEEELPVPLAPLIKGQVLRDRSGRAVKGAGGRPIPARDEEDEGYRAKLRRRNEALTMATLLACTNGQLETETTKREDHESAEDYYLAIRSELAEAGVDPGRMATLMQTAARLIAPMTVEEMDEAREALGVDEASQEGVPKGKSGGPPRSTGD